MTHLMIGGLLRCCVQTWDEATLEVQQSADTLKCIHCKKVTMKREGDTWRWVGPTEADA